MSFGTEWLLTILDLRGNFALKEVPEAIGCLTHLARLDCSDCTSLLGLPRSIGNLKRLKYLSLRNCKHFRNLPDAIHALEFEQVVNVCTLGCYFDNEE